MIRLTGATTEEIADLLYRERVRAHLSTAGIAVRTGLTNPETCGMEAGRALPMAKVLAVLNELGWEVVARRRK